MMFTLSIIHYQTTKTLIFNTKLHNKLPTTCKQQQTCFYAVGLVRVIIVRYFTEKVTDNYNPQIINRKTIILHNCCNKNCLIATDVLYSVNFAKYTRDMCIKVKSSG